VYCTGCLCVCVSARVCFIFILSCLYIENKKNLLTTSRLRRICVYLTCLVIRQYYFQRFLFLYTKTTHYLFVIFFIYISSSNVYCTYYIYILCTLSYSSSSSFFHSDMTPCFSSSFFVRAFFFLLHCTEPTIG